MSQARRVAVTISAISAIFAGIPGEAGAQSLPTIVVDQAHSVPGNQDAIEYEIPAAGGLIVDPGAYKFQFKDVSVPDAIHLVAGKNGKYKTHWKGPPDRKVLDSTTLEPLPGSEPFRGFATGDTLIVAIGADRPSNSLAVMWVGLVKVK